MPIVIIRAGDIELSGRVSCSEIEASGEALEKIEAIRLQAGIRMGLGNVRNAVVPKMFLVSRAINGGCIRTRSLIPRKFHESIGVFAAVSVATACVLLGTIAHATASLPEGMVMTLDIEHPTGVFPVRLERGETADLPTVERGGLIRTARALFDGVVFPRGKRPREETKA